MTVIEALIEQHKKQATGVLTLKEGEVQRHFTFKKGLMTYVESKQREESFGHFLLSIGRINEEQLLTVINKMMTDKTMQGDTLVALGILTPAEVFELLTKQMIEKLKNSLLMQNCSIDFSPQITSNNLDFPIPFYRALLDGLVDHYTPERYKKEGHFQRDANLKLSAEGKERVNNLQLLNEELKALRKIDGQCTFADFVSRVANKRVAAALVFFLYKLGYLELLRPQRTIESSIGTMLDEALPAATTAPAIKPEPSANSGIADNMYKLLLRMKPLSLYQMLEVPEEAPNAQIERAYNIICKRHHLTQIDQHYQEADRQGAHQLLDMLTHAFYVLSNDKRRQLYQQQRGKAQPTETQPADPKLKAEVEALKAGMSLRFNNPKTALEFALAAIRLNAAEASYHVLGAQAQMKCDLQPEGGAPSKKVEDMLRKAMELSPQGFKAPLELGYYYKMLDNNEKAESFFRKALELNQKCRQAEAELRLIEKRNEKNKGSNLFASFRKKA